MTFSIMASFVTPSINDTRQHYAECRYDGVSCLIYCYADCRYVKCCHAECRGAVER
jgi:hypothetical protein